MGPGVLLALLHEVHAAERTLVGHLLRLYVLRCEEQLLGVEQQHPGLLTGVDHRVRFLEGDAQRLLAHDVLAGPRGVDRDLRMETVGRRNGNHLDLGIAQQVAIVGVRLRDTVALGERGGVALRRRGDRDELGLFRDRLYRARDAISLKPRADDADFDSRHREGRQNTCGPGGWTGSHTATPTRESAVP